MGAKQVVGIVVLVVLVAVGLPLAVSKHEDGPKAEFDLHRHQGESDEPNARPWSQIVPRGLNFGRLAPKVVISIDTGRCNPPESALDRIDVEETSDTVTITPYIEPEERGGIHALCLSYFTETVDLDEPIAGRTLIDGRTGRPAKVQESFPQPLGAGRAHRLRVAILDGARVDFGPTNSPAEFQQCFFERFPNQLTDWRLSSLVFVQELYGDTAYVAQALNGLAAPVAAKCGGKSNVPELTDAAERFGG